VVRELGDAARNADWRDFPAPAMAGERSVGLTV
jgi:hypothetical protein